MKNLCLFVCALALFGCPEEEPDPAAPPAPPGFNFIPDYSNACVPTDEASRQAAEAALASLTGGHEFLVAETFEVCSPRQQSACAPCSDDASSADYNALGAALNNADDWASSAMLGVVGVESSDLSGLEAYFAEALAYPWRHLAVHAAPGDAVYYLNPVQANQCVLDAAKGSGDCGTDDEYTLTVDGMDRDCSQFRNGIQGSFASTSVTTGLPGAEGFGFQVPLARGMELPPVSDFDSVQALEHWLSQQVKLVPVLAEPDVTVSEVNGQLCGRLTGVMNASVFDTIASDASKVDAFEDPERPGAINVVLTMELHGARVALP